MPTVRFTEEGSDQEVVRLRHEQTPDRPDLWTLRVRRQNTAVPLVGDKVWLSLPGVAKIVLHVRHTVERKAGLLRLSATRLPSDQIGLPIRAVQQGLLPAVLGSLGRWLSVSAKAQVAIQNVRLHALRPAEWPAAGGGESAAEFVRWLRWRLAAELGIYLSLRPSENGLQLFYPREETAKEEGMILPTVVESHGRPDPLACRPGRRTLRERWSVETLPADWKGAWDEWQRVAGAPPRATGLHLTRFRATWRPPGKDKSGGGHLWLTRRWHSFESVLVRCRRRTSLSAWTALARMGAATTVEGVAGALFNVLPLLGFEGEWKEVPGTPLVCRLATPYAGTSERSCGLHLVPEKTKLVLIGSPSVFTWPVILGEVREAAVGCNHFGLYLPPDRDWELQAPHYHVKADAVFDPPSA